ncbi:MAG: hypothetical protein M0C28_23925 [Candidatus Moduliflexus flocculans]|nr:hypothetical protein [Candidatus Moduliflexus flocculans]
MGALRPGPLPEAVPAEVLVGGRGHTQGQGRRLRQLGELLPQPHQLGAQPRPARPRPLEDGEPDQHPDLGAWSAIRTTGPWTRPGTSSRTSTGSS